MENSTMFTGSSKLEFSWFDYGLFLMMLLLSALIGVYFGFIKKQSTAKDYLLGGREMSVFPIAMSLIATVISGITLLAVPADIYRYGVSYWLCIFTITIATFLSYHMCMPIFYELQITSTYEYLERRFDIKVRTFASAVFTFAMFLYLPIVIYIPALALSQATGVSIHFVTPVICGVCVFYTTFGGLKAVVWTDALQFIVMVGTIIVITFLGVSSAGGFETIWHRNKEYGRLNMDFSFNATKRDTVWTGTIGTFFLWFSYVGSNQGFVQKCIALPTYKNVRNALIIFVIGTMAIISFSTYAGLIMFTKYFDCDPLTARYINQPDQLLPYYIMDVGRAIPGLPGLFTAGIFSAALSTLSAVINCLSATLYEDFVSRFVKEGTSEKTVGNYLKLLAVSIGIICTGLVFFIPYMGSILPLSLSVGGITGGSMLGLFLCGMLFPCVNAKGALWGGITSLAAMSWIVFGSQYYKAVHMITYPNLPLMVHGCPNSTVMNTTTIEFNQVSPHKEPSAIYKVSFYYYSVMGTIIVLVVALVVSKCTSQNAKPVEKKYFSPLIRNMIKEADVPPDYYSLDQEDKLRHNSKEK